MRSHGLSSHGRRMLRLGKRSADEVRLCYVNLAQTWLDAASWVSHHCSTPLPLSERPYPKYEAA